MHVGGIEERKAETELILWERECRWLYVVQGERKRRRDRMDVKDGGEGRKRDERGRKDVMRRYQRVERQGWS